MTAKNILTALSFAAVTLFSNAALAGDGDKKAPLALELKLIKNNEQPVLKFVGNNEFKSNGMYVISITDDAGYELYNAVVRGEKLSATSYMLDTDDLNGVALTFSITDIATDRQVAYRVLQAEKSITQTHIVKQ